MLHYEVNKKSYLNKARRWQAENKDKSYYIKRKYADSEESLLKKRLYSKEYKKRNRHIYSHAQKLRHTRKLKAMPKWLSPEQVAEIKSIYKQASDTSESTGTPHHVDHIVPLDGKIVCGLHVPWNLRVIPGTENLKRPKTFVQLWD
jgi:hypothetical protein